MSCLIFLVTVGVKIVQCCWSWKEKTTLFWPKAPNLIQARRALGSNDKDPTLNIRVIHYQAFSVAVVLGWSSWVWKAFAANKTGSGAGRMIERQTFEQSGWPTITSNWLDFFTELNRTEFKLQMGERKTSMPSWCCTRTAFSFIQWTIYRKTGQQPVQ